MTAPGPAQFSDGDLWDVVDYTIENILLPVLPPGYERDAAVQLAGIARFARSRPSFPLAVTKRRLSVALGRPLDTDPTQLIVDAGCVLAATVTKTGGVAETGLAAEIRGALLDDLAAEVEAATPLLQTFARHGREAVEPVQHQLPADQHQRLEGWLSEVLGSPTTVGPASVMPGGHSRKMLRVTAQSVQGPRELFLRLDQDGMFGTQGDEEARALIALEMAGTPVPPVVGLDADGTVLGTPFFAMQVVPGTTDLEAGDLDRYIHALHEVHQLDPVALASALGPVPASPEEAVQASIERWERVYRESDVGPIPLLDEAIAWLRHNLRPTGEVSIVHGDPGPGNFLVDRQRIVALIDWEFVSYGDPAADWSYLATIRGRSLRSLPEWQRHLEQLLGISYDSATWHSWEIYNRFKAVCADLTPFAIVTRGLTRPPNLVAVGAGIHKRFLSELADLATRFGRGTNP